MITRQAGISILDSTKDALNAFDNLKRYHELSDIASALSILLLDELDQLQPKNFLSLGDFLSTFSTKVMEYNNIAPVVLTSEMKKLKLQQCIVGDERLINSMSTLRIAARAAGKAKPRYTEYIEALTKDYNTHDAANISKKHAKSTPTQQVLMGEVNHYNNDYEDEFFDANDCAAFDIQFTPPDTLRSFTTNLLAAHESVSRRHKKRGFNPEINIPSIAFRELSDERVKLWYQFNNKDRKVIVSMHEYPKEELSVAVPYQKPKPTMNVLSSRYKNNNWPSNKLTNSTEILDIGKDLVT